MRGTKKAGIPEFKSLEEERNYWEARGPLAEGRTGRINRPKPGQKRSSFLAVRLTGEEITRLRDIAAKQGLGPSTYARLILTRAIENESRAPKVLASDELKDLLMAREAIEHYLASYEASSEPASAETRTVGGK